MNSSLGRTLKLYLIDGTPSGVITAELGVSSVRAVMASRTALPDLIKREEAARTGVYLLVGPDPNLPTRQLVYVGEGDQVKARLAAHDSDETKEFFTRAVLVVSKDENLTKAHGRYLESRLIAQIKVAGRARLANGTSPEFARLPEPEIADMERVLEEIETLLPVLGFDVLRPAGDGLVGGTTKIPKERTFVLSEAGTEARAHEAGGEFVLLTGSRVRAGEVPSAPESLRKSRAEALAAGDVVFLNDEYWQVARDMAFSSPSGAAAFVYGGSINGRRYWKDEKTGRSYADIRADEIEEGADE